MWADDECECGRVQDGVNVMCLYTNALTLKERVAKKMVDDEINDNAIKLAAYWKDKIKLQKNERTRIEKKEKEKEKLEILYRIRSESRFNYNDRY